MGLVKNGNHTFYTLDFNLNGTSLTATDEEKNLSNDLMSIGIGCRWSDIQTVLLK
ncbi:MAG: hypothetical protein ACLVFD_00075 [Anaerostipes hadrus]